MKFKAALFYNGHIVYYNVYVIGDNIYKVKLDTYYDEPAPPQVIELYKNGYIWKANCEDNELVKELGAAIEQRAIHHHI